MVIDPVVPQTVLIEIDGVQIVMEPVHGFRRGPVLDLWADRPGARSAPSETTAALTQPRVGS